MTFLLRGAWAWVLLLLLAQAGWAQTAVPAPAAKSAIPEAYQKPAQPPMAPGTAMRDCPECPDVVVVPGGSFWMGSPAGTNAAGTAKAPWGQANEMPQHRVEVPAFAMGKHEVTQQQWKALMGENPSFRKARNLPVENVRWHDAQAYVRKLSEKTQKNYRLPSEAEWEYAARAGTRTEWGFAHQISLGDYAWYHAVSEGKTHPVGLKLPNAYGLFDMHGNVWEWVEDCYHDNYVGAPTDGSAWKTGCGVPYGVIRGGSFDLAPQLLRSAVRYWIYPSQRAYYIGFRVARDL
jgi:formylglycine-generating enzyme required for sulfatase activity